MQTTTPIRPALAGQASHVRPNFSIQNQSLPNSSNAPVTPIPVKVVNFFTRIWIFILSILGEDFVFLALLGFCMACIVHLINRGVAICNGARMWLWGQIAINQHYASQYFAWTALPVVLILFSTAFTDVVSPAAKGSGKWRARWSRKWLSVG